MKVGPELVGRRQTTTISVLVDGARPHLVCTQPVLAHVTLIPHEPPDAARAAKALMAGAMAMSVGAMVAGAWLTRAR